MKEIPLTKGYVALVDDEDFERLSQWNWWAHLERNGERVYAVRQIRLPSGSRPKIKMHKEIMGVRPGFEVDHRDRNQLNNQRHNLRWATDSQNSANRVSRRLSGVGFKGVYPSGKATFRARILAKRKIRNLGTFPAAEDAARAYNVAALKWFGEFAVLNEV